MKKTKNGNFLYNMLDISSKKKKKAKSAEDYFLIFIEGIIGIIIYPLILSPALWISWFLIRFIPDDPNSAGANSGLGFLIVIITPIVAVVLIIIILKLIKPIITKILHK